MKTSLLAVCGCVALVVACSRAAPARPDVPAPAASSELTSAAKGEKGACAKTTYGDAAGEPSRAPVSCNAGEIAIAGKAFTVAPSGEGALAAPARRLVVNGFCLDATEVSVGALNQCGACVAAAGPIPGNASRPVRGLDAATMERFCAERGKRLPTEAELELAAEGATGASCQGSAPCDVGATPTDRSAAGVMDLGGNVAELTSTEICACEPDGTCRTGRVVRGSSYATPGKGARTRTLRGAQDGTDPTLGFRCARTP